MEKRENRNQQVVAIVTDSIAQVPEEIANKLDISVIPFAVNINHQRYLDGINLSPQNMYQRMRSEQILPTTSAPSIGEYLEIFRSRLNKGAQAILHISLSSRLSSGYENACEAAKQASKEFPGSHLEVLDSRQGTISEGFIAIAAAVAASKGGSLEEVEKTARQAMNQCGLAAAPSTLEYLARGGRIGKAAYLLGSMIDIKPILTLDDGTVIPVKNVRTDKHALEAIVNYIVQKVKGYKKLYLGIMAADDAERASMLQGLALQKLKPDKLFQTEFTPVMGVHTGPGVIGLAYYFE